MSTIPTGSHFPYFKEACFIQARISGLGKTLILRIGVVITVNE